MFLTREIARVSPYHANFRDMGTLDFEVESIKIKKRFFFFGFLENFTIFAGDYMEVCENLLLV